MKGLISVKHKGSFRNTEDFFKRSLKSNWRSILEDYGRKGVQVLSDATPKESGETASRWSYEIQNGNGQVTIAWKNDHENQGANIVILIMYGHGLWNGGYIEGNDFVHPSIIPIMQELADRVWKEVTR